MSRASILAKIVGPNDLISETINNTTYPLLSQYDIGTGPQDVPLNGYLGSMAFQDSAFPAVANLGFVGVGGRIVGDFSNATHSNRVFFQTNTTNGNTVVGAIPNGSGAAGQFAVYSQQDPNNASQGQFLIDSSAGIMSIRSNVTGTGTYLPMTFYTGGSERVRVDTAGNVGIGTILPNARLEVSASGDTTVARISNTGSSINSRALLRFVSQSSTYGSSVFQTNGSDSAYATSALNIYTFDSQPIAFGTGNTERARIDSSGNLLVGRTSNYSASYKLQVGDSTGAAAISLLSNSSGAWIYGADTINYSSGGWTLGHITTTANKLQARCGSTGGVELTSGGTSWAAISDERLKDIIEPITEAAQKVSMLRAVIGKYKTDENGTRRSFLIAQDVQAVLPEAVSTTKMSKEDEQEYLTVAYTDIIPLLVAAIQEQQAIITQLQADVAALKGI